METRTVPSIGIITYWRLNAVEVKHDALTKSWDEESLPSDWLPKPPRLSKVLRRAVTDLKEPRRLPRRLERAGAWAVVDESPVGEEGLEHHISAKAKLEEGLLVVEGNGLAEKIREGFDHLRDIHRAHDLSMLLIESAANCKSICLRGGGGIYFIPESQVPTWLRVARAVERVAQGGTVYRLSVQIEPASVAAVLDGLTAEVTQQIDDIDADLRKEGDEALGKRALATRASLLTSLVDKVQSYEALVGQALPQLQEGLSTLHAAVLIAKMKSEAPALEPIPEFRTETQ